MFALIAGEGSGVPGEIEAMASALPGTRSPSGPWLHKHGWYSAATTMPDILPEDLFDCQPLVDDDLVFVCRARLDNRRDLLATFEIGSAEGATLSDGHLLRLAWRKWRDAAPQHVYGDFVFAAFERSTRRLVAASDPFGHYPLFYSQLGRRILISTQLSALMAHPSVEPTLDLRAVGLMAASRIGEGWTMFRNLQHLPGGTLLTFQSGQLVTERWWRPETAARVFYKRAGEYVEETRDLFEAAVKSCLRARGEIASTLSGGLDSTLVSASAARQLARDGRSLYTFTSVPEPGLPVDRRPGWVADDSPWASAVAALYPNMRHSLVPPAGLNPLDILPALHAASRTPFRHTPNLVWAWKISRLALSCGASVVLCGEHGNGSISLPGSYGDAGPAARFFSRPLEIVKRLSDPDLRSYGEAWLRRLEHGVRQDRGVRQARARQADEPRRGVRILTGDFAEAHREELRRMKRPEGERDLFTAFMTAPGRAPRPEFAALFGVEWRDPTGDRRLLERLLAFPLHAFRAGNRPRGLARELGRGLLPDQVRLRRTRGAQCPDEAAWFAVRPADYRSAVQRIKRSAACGEFLDLRALESLVDELCAGRGSAADATTAHRALDAGLFTVAFETGALWAKGNASRGNASTAGAYV